MRYRFRCADESCSNEFDMDRPMAARNEPAECPACGMPATRIFPVPNVNAAYGNSDEAAENRNFEGRDEAERTATRKADDARYESRMTRTTRTVPEP